MQAGILMIYCKIMECAKENPIFTSLVGIFIMNPIIPSCFSWWNYWIPSTSCWQLKHDVAFCIIEGNKVPIHTSVFSTVAIAFSDMWASQFTFPRLIFPNVVESIITVSWNLNKYDSIHLHLCPHHLLLLFICPHLQRARVRPFFLSQLPIFFLL